MRIDYGKLKEDVLRRVSLRDFVGNDKRILCPLPSHNDSKPSCDVDHGRGVWHCKACNVGGDLIRLVELQHNLNGKEGFKEALRILADKGNLRLDDYQAKTTTTDDQPKARTADALQFYADYYHERFVDEADTNAQLQRFMKERRLSLATIKKLRLGYDDGNLRRAISNNTKQLNGLTYADFFAAGLVNKSKNNGTEPSLNGSDSDRTFEKSNEFGQNSELLLSEQAENMQEGYTNGQNSEKVLSESDEFCPNQDDFEGDLSAQEKNNYYHHLKKRFTIPALRNGHVLQVSCRWDDSTQRKDSTPKYLHNKGSHVAFYNEDAIGEAVWLFEGHSDTIMGVELGLPAVGVMGTGGLMEPQRLANVKHLTICPDNDVPGVMACKQWIKAIVAANPKCVIEVLSLPSGVNDFNEYFTALPYFEDPRDTRQAREAALAALMEGKKPYLQWMMANLKDASELETDIWPTLRHAGEVERAQAINIINAHHPILGGKDSLRKALREWCKKAAAEELRSANKSCRSTIDLGAVLPISRYMAADYKETDTEAQYHVCIYAPVRKTIFDEVLKEPVETLTQEPVLVTSVVGKFSHAQTVTIKTVDEDGGPWHSDCAPMPEVVAKRWVSTDVAHFLDQQKADDTATLVRDIEALLREFVWLKDPNGYAVLALYIAGTYLCQMLGSFPYLSLNGQKGSGKTNILILLEKLCFNSRVVSMGTRSDLMRAIESTSITWIRDEAENFSKTTEHNDEFMEVLKAGYKKDTAYCSVTEGDGKGNFRPRTYRVYGPKIFAGINRLDAVLRDRCLVIETHKAPSDVVGTLKNTSQNARYIEAKTTNLRNRLYRWALLRFWDLNQIVEKYPAIKGLENRDWELWMPILSIATLADVDAKEPNGFAPRIQEFAKAQIADKEEFERDYNRDLIVLRTLYELLAAGAIPSVFGEAGWRFVSSIVSHLKTALTNNPDVPMEIKMTGPSLRGVLTRNDLIKRGSKAKPVWNPDKSMSEKAYHLKDFDVLKAVLAIDSAYFDQLSEVIKKAYSSSLLEKKEGRGTSEGRATPQNIGVMQF